MRQKWMHKQQEVFSDRTNYKWYYPILQGLKVLCFFTIPLEHTKNKKGLNREKINIEFLKFQVTKFEDKLLIADFSISVLSKAFLKIRYLIQKRNFTANNRQKVSQENINSVFVSQKRLVWYVLLALTVLRNKSFITT